MDIYNWGIGLVVTGRIRDIGKKRFTLFSNRKQQQLQLLQKFLLITFLEQAVFFRSIV
jgi:hypothetical protein